MGKFIRVNFIVHMFVAFFYHISADLLVNTKYGQVRGFQTDTAKAFLGIPFALPPVGSLRWKNPQKPKSWSPDIYNATSYKPACPQKDCEIMNPAIMCPKETSEDCLHLNIWTPTSVNSTSSLPVMVYIHGGNFDHMYAGAAIFNGENLANRGNVIVANMDYRIGALGFLLTMGSEGASGNFGIQDQRHALKWIKENIKNFGGDPSKVTLFGQSAGAQSVTVHLMTKESSQYFDKAIIQSAPISLPFKSYDEMIFLSNMLADELNCSAGDLECLNSKSVDDITSAQLTIKKYPSSTNILEFFEPWVPYVDGVIVPFEPLVAIKEGYFDGKPVMIGTTTEETRPFIYEGFQKDVSAVKYTTLLSLLRPSHALQILSTYPSMSGVSDQKDNLEVPATDVVFTCSTRNYTRNLILRNGGKVWKYVFDHSFSFVEGWGHLTFCRGHVCHGAELPFVFRTADLYNFTMTADETKLSDSIMTYWLNFARNGDSNIGDPVTIKWPRYSSEELWPNMHFKIPSNIISGNYRKYYCDFWDNIGYLIIKQ